MESSTNRFADSDDLSGDNCDLKKLTAECEKWSHKNDLQLLSHLKQMSNNLINKTENTNQSIDSLVFETKMHCVKVDNVINEFQMLANSQFVENRVYDEEMEDIITSGQNIQNEESINPKSKEEEILNKIKVSLNIGLDFLNQRFDCVSNKVSQNDSDDENDEILEGLISNSARDEYSQRALPYIIGSEDFIKDNYVGLSKDNYGEESPAIDLSETRIDSDFSVKSVESDSKSNTFEAQNITNSNNFNDYINDSEEEPNDLFGTIPKKTQESDDLFDSIPNEEPNDLFGNVPKPHENTQKSISSSDESDSEPFASEDKVNVTSERNESNQIKPSMPSFHDELSARLKGKKPDIPSFDDKDETKSQSIVNKNQLKSALSFESESSDENESIFKVTQTKHKIENKQKNDLFGEETTEETTEESLFAPKPQGLISADKQINKVLLNSKTQNILEKTSTNLFDDDDDDEDDLFGAISKKINKSLKPVLNETSEKVSKSFTQSDSYQKKPLVSKPNLFSDDEEGDDLFSSVSSKPKPNVQNSDAFKPIVKPNISSKPLKPTDSLIGELSSAFKKKKLLKSDDESDSNSENEFKVNNFKIKSQDSSDDRTIKEMSPSNASEKIEEKNDSLFNDNIFNEKTSSETESEIKTNDISIPKSSNESNFLNNDFYIEESALPLTNDVLKHRVALGAKLNRRPPSKRLLKMTSIADFDQNSTKQETIPNVEEEERPIAAIRKVKTVSNILDDQIEDKPNDVKSDLSIENTFKSMSNLIKSPSTEEDDIFPTQTNISKNQNISKIFEKSENTSILAFDHSGDNEESLFTSNKTIKNDISKGTASSKGLFDTSDSDDDNFLSKKSSNVISNIIKPSKSEVFNDVSSTDSSLSNKSDLKIGNSKPSVTLFSDSDDDDLFSAVTKNKSIEKKAEKPITRIETRTQKSEKSPEKIKKTNSLFSDDENTDLFEKKEINSIKPKTKTKPLFDLDDDEDDDDIFAAKSSTKTSISSKSKPRKESQSSDLFDDPLFASRS